ncbi:MAG: hypothetical protein DM484_18260 [Candidatus Methylumidiphilus alinenensis]|uniref:Protein NO VEIN C-terminal domain-containing protein n=1 Tax=Candidatus Methylumidiphilus alinenensis TaxID=2202197 RepID=A0A2W4SJN6_9GAMM|nr:MAG: hypothetical protein DM484_18260 [Candidatus Methylumidiphilus alinenensis]
MKESQLTVREKSIIAGLYLSKFDFDGLRYLGFNSFKEAFNVIGLALGVPEKSIHNYRDEFDPLFPNDRLGWHKRKIRDCCKVVYEEYKDVDMDTLSKILKKSLYKNPDIDMLIEQTTEVDFDLETSFAKRLITGQAAEKYFINKFPTIESFSGYSMENTTNLGCGFDFKLSSSAEYDFLALEVKGINDLHGSISLTQKEYSVAKILGVRYFLFVVKNFKESPMHDIYINPLKSDLSFTKNEHKITQVTWSSTI